MESFYGGRQGASFLIKKSFKYINEQDPAYQADLAAKLADGVDEDFAKRDLAPLTMELCFLDGNYQEVWYNEHCIIDTINKNNPNNGKIFRRVLQTQDTNGNTSLPYEYLGTIVGPSSGAPMLKPQSGLLDFETIRSQFPEGHWDGLGLSEDKDGKTTLKIYDPSFSDGDLSTWPSSVTLKEESITIDNEGMVPGAVIKGEYINGVFENTAVEYTDDIKYNWFNVRKNTENDDGVVESWCYIGFKIPYPVFSTSAIYKTPGTRPKAYEVNRNDDTDSIEHPFWYDWRFEIPGGLRGVSIEKIFINDTDVEDNDNNNLYQVSAYVFDDLDYDTDTDTYTFKEGKTPQLYKDRGWFCKARILNPSATTDSPELLKQTDESDTVTFFLGEITEIDNVTLNTETGHLEFVYHNQASDVYDLRYPIDVDMDEDAGHVTTYYSIPEYNEDGTIKKDENGNVVHTKEEWDFHYPINIQMDEETGEVITTYSCAKGENMPAKTTHNFRYPIDVHMNTKTGEVTTTYSLIDRTEDGEPVLDENGEYIHETETEYFRYPIDVDMNPETGHVEVKYSLLEEDGVTHTKEEWGFEYPILMDMNTDTGVITTQYSTPDNTKTSGHKEIEWKLDYPKSVNFIEKTESSGLKYYDKVQIDYSRTGIKETPLGYTYKVEVDDNNDQGYIKFINTQGENYSQKHDFSYPTNISINAETGKVLTTYFGAADETSYVSFIEDVKISPAHELLIAYTGDVNNVNFTGYEPVVENGKTYINYGQTISKLGVESSPITGPDTEKILEQFESTYPLGVKDGEVTGQLFVVTTSDKNNPVSYFVMWNPNTQKWEIVSEIAGSPVGIPAQIGSDFTSWTYENVSLFADGNMQFIQYPNNEVESTSLTLNTPWK